MPEIDVRPEDFVDDPSNEVLAPEKVAANTKLSRKQLENLQRSMRHGVLVALPKEYAAVDAVFGEPKRWPNANNVDTTVRYVEFETAAGDKRTILIAGTTSAGIAQAAAQASLIKWTNRHVNKIILVGIAGGQPALEDGDKDVCLGDVVVGQRVVQHDHVKVTDGDVERRGDHLQVPDSQLLEVVGRLQAKFQLTGDRGKPFPWTQHIESGEKALLHSARPAKDQNEELRKYDKTMVRTGRRANEPFVHIGTIASGSMLLKDAGKRDEMARDFGAIAYEMEGAGIAIASTSNDFKYLVVRGICDYADVNKNDEWQPYAALVATSFTRALLEEL